MPARDGTGPQGLGPRTGRGAGNCPPGTGGTGWTWPCSGWFGAGRGRRNRFYATGIPGWAATPPQQTAADLEKQADWLKSLLASIQKRIDEMKSK